MRTISRNLQVVRRWAEDRDASPRLTHEGDLALALPDDGLGAGEPISWDEFAGIFTAEKLCFVHDDVPGSDFHAIGTERDVGHLAEETAPGAPPA